MTKQSRIFMECIIALVFHTVRLCQLHIQRDLSTTLYFLGYAKDRLEDILNAFFCFSSQGYHCHFIVCGVPKSKQVHAEELFFRGPITYEENIRNVQQSKCIFELVQHDSTGLTLRYRESIVYHRKLLTNNPDVVQKPGYNRENIEVFQKPEDVSGNFLKSQSHYQAYGINPFAPEKQLVYFENLLTGGMGDG